MMPALPMPVRMTWPLQLRSRSTAHEKRASSRLTSARIAAASVSRTLRAKARSPMRQAHSGRPCPPDFRLPGDGVNRHETAEKGLELVERERVLRVALRTRLILVDLEKHPVHAPRDAG